MWRMVPRLELGHLLLDASPLGLYRRKPLHQSTLLILGGPLPLIKVRHPARARAIVATIALALQLQQRLLVQLALFSREIPRARKFLRQLDLERGRYFEVASGEAQGRGGGCSGGCACPLDTREAEYDLQTRGGCSGGCACSLV